MNNMISSAVILVGLVVTCLGGVAQERSSWVTKRDAEFGFTFTYPPESSRQVRS